MNLGIANDSFFSLLHDLLQSGVNQSYYHLFLQPRHGARQAKLQTEGNEPHQLAKSLSQSRLSASGNKLPMPKPAALTISSQLIGTDITEAAHGKIN